MIHAGSHSAVGPTFTHSLACGIFFQDSRSPGWRRDAGAARVHAKVGESCWGGSGYLDVTSATCLIEGYSKDIPRVLLALSAKDGGLSADAEEFHGDKIGTSF